MKKEENDMNINKVPKSELDSRLERFIGEIDSTYNEWEMCVITGSVGMFYLTGTICDGLLLIRRGEGATLWVRRSYERCLLESEFSDIRSMRSFRDIAGAVGVLPDTLYLDMAHASMEWYGIFSKYLKFKNLLPIDKVMLKTRSVKSEYELERMRISGSKTDLLLREALPHLLHEGISELELYMDLYWVSVKNGHEGYSRFSMLNTDVSLGHVGFGDSPLYPSVFNGASGAQGLCPAVPALGSRSRLLRNGDLVYVDICCCIDGYNTDKTLIYSFNDRQPDNVVHAHQHCLALHRHAVSLLSPGTRPSDIYAEIMDMVLPEYKHNFMGAPGRTVPFIGHGVGLYVDEMPVIAKGFDTPLENGMTIAIEPKIGIEGIGMVGSENTYLVTDNGGESLTGECLEILVVCDRN